MANQKPMRNIDYLVQQGRILFQQGRIAFPEYWKLMRFDRPIGILLLLWPTLWGLWLAGQGIPDFRVLFIFVVGVVLMRAAGCVINDFADRKIDGHVERTRGRPLAAGKVTAREAIALFTALVSVAFLLVLMTNQLTVLLSFGALALASVYPFMKRHTHLPQVVLGAAFSWSVVMAFAAQTGTVPAAAWLLYTAVVLWTVVYDTFYAMVDREDDLKIGVKSTAVLFGENDRLITAVLQVLTLATLIMVGTRFQLGWVYDLSLVVVMALFLYQQYLIRGRDRALCFQAFLNNNWVGAAVFLGIALDYAIA